MPDEQMAHGSEEAARGAREAVHGAEEGSGPSRQTGDRPDPPPESRSEARSEARPDARSEWRPEARPPARPLDAIDRDLLRLLRADGRASIRSVAERVHVSRANAYARINRLLDDGVIRGFSARIDQERAGHGASAYITLKIVQNSWRSVREKLQELPGAAHMALVSGDFDVLLLVHTPDTRALRDLVLTRIQSFPEVLSTRTLLVFEETDLEPGP
ncbi:Lrp/AsnC family transcriptional regulator [Streptomyces reniochalinae]|uniref:Lrp/AsnC family transcriptional regulator n=1 Tax=Streptomyces reniochalinae TaxID=2250578 RepID=UPI0026919D99